MSRKVLHQIVLLLAALAASGPVVYADSTGVDLDSGGLFVFDQGTNKLTGGTSADGDGAVIQLGYYSAATTMNNFAGTWVPLTGEGSANTAPLTGSPPPNEPYNKTSIGDLTSQGGAVGEFWMGTLSFGGTPTSSSNLPSSTTIPLAGVFYNNTTIATSTFYNVVSDDAWLWKTPSTPPAPNINVTLSLSGLEWLSTSMGQPTSNEFHTSIPLQAVPEPATIGAGILCAASLFGSALLRCARKSA